MTIMESVKKYEITFARFLDFCEVVKKTCPHCESESQQRELLVQFLKVNAFNWLMHFEQDKVIAIFRFAAIEINIFDAYSRDVIIDESIEYAFEYMEAWWKKVTNEV